MADFFQIARSAAMADEIDLANDLIDNEVSRALSKLRQNSFTGKPTNRILC